MAPPKAGPYRLAPVRPDPPQRREGPGWALDLLGALATLCGLPHARRTYRAAVRERAERERRYLDQIGFPRAFEISLLVWADASENEVDRAKEDG